MQRRSFLQTAMTMAAAAAAPVRYVMAQTRKFTDRPARSVEGKEIMLKGSDLETLRSGFSGVLLVPSDADYERYRHIWNGMFDKHPALIARVANTADVIKAVQFAAAYQLLTSVRCGGHSFSGKSVNDGGLMIDMTLMKGVTVDRNARTVRIEGGVLLGDMDKATQAYGLATTAGTVSHTGASGLTLGGGYGRMSRKYQLACDNLESAELVTANGQVVTASEDEHPDLFWAVRGGGGNFGVSTAFTFFLHEVGPIVYGGRLAYEFKDARDVLTFYADYAANAPDEVFGGCGLVVGPDGAPSFGLSYNYCGTPEDGERALAPLRKFRKPIADTCQATPYLTLQTSSDVNWPHGRNYYMKSGFIRRIEPAVIEEVIGRYANNPRAQVRTTFYQVGGAANRVPRDATAYWERDAEFDVMIFAAWDGPPHGEVNAQNVEAVREHWKGMEPHVNGVYLNSEGEASIDKVRATFGDNYARLVKVKTAYDPGNLFRMNANIPPAGV